MVEGEIIKVYKFIVGDRYVYYFVVMVSQVNIRKVITLDSKYVFLLVC